EKRPWMNRIAAPLAAAASGRTQRSCSACPPGASTHVGSSARRVVGVDVAADSMVTTLLLCRLAVAGRGEEVVQRAQLTGRGAHEGDAYHGLDRQRGRLVGRGGGHEELLGEAGLIAHVGLEVAGHQ